MNILIFFIILLVLVLVHEFGHFFAAKRFGIRVDEFGFGFPPKLFGKKWGETEYTFNLLPLGGFVKIFGENPDEENTNGPNRARSFVHKPAWQQAVVLFAGVFANFILAGLLFSVGFMSGLPTSVGSEAKNYPLENVHLVILSVSKDSPAEMAGLKSGDTIVSLRAGLDSTKEINPDTVKYFIVTHPKSELEVGYTRGQEKNINLTKLTPTLNEAGEALIGISMDQVGTSKLPFFMALKEGMRLNWYVTKNTAVGLYSLIVEAFRGNGSFAAVTGPVGMAAVVGEVYSFGFIYLLSFTAIISINLAIVNLLPFPALDGGRLLFLLIEKIKGSPMNPKIVNATNTTSFALLIILMLFITYHDIIKLL